VPRGYGVRTARDSSVSASDSQVETLSSPVFESVRDWATERRMDQDTAAQAAPSAARSPLARC